MAFLRAHATLIPPGYRLMCVHTHDAMMCLLRFRAYKSIRLQALGQSAGNDLEHFNLWTLRNGSMTNNPSLNISHNARWWMRTVWIYIIICLFIISRSIVRQFSSKRMVIMCWVEFCSFDWNVYIYKNIKMYKYIHYKFTELNILRIHVEHSIFFEVSGFCLIIFNIFAVLLSFAGGFKKPNGILSIKFAINRVV